MLVFREAMMSLIKFVFVCAVCNLAGTYFGQAAVQELVDQCANHPCPAGSECQVLYLLALRGPDPLPAVPFCQTITTTTTTTTAAPPTEDPCEGVVCHAGQECHVVRPTCRLCTKPPPALTLCRNTTTTSSPLTTASTHNYEHHG